MPGIRWRQCMRSHRQYPRWLLLFYSVTDQAAVRPFLPPAGKGRVLITSRSAVWARGRAVEVPDTGF